jgi:hypothetical protein
MRQARYDSVRLAALSMTVLWILAIGVAGCGGGSNTQSGTAEPTIAGNDKSTQAGESSPGGATHHEGRKPSHRYRGGEKDIEEFGTEARGPEAEAVLTAQQTYLAAIVSRNYGKACTWVSSSLEAQFSQIVEPGVGPKSCDQVLPKILAGDASHVAALQLSGKIVKVRVEGDRGYVVFHAPGARLFVFPMTREGGSWRVASITSSILAPSAATLGEG